jgi:pyruvate/2-oxoglutarate dehydrogenase complex dihydrolipoamide acyltransferase (E2) component
LATTATRKARDLADELGVDLADVEGTGKDDRATVADVRATAAAQSSTGRPADFGPDEATIWDEVIAYLEGFKLWNPLFAPLLERYIRRLKRAEDARRRAEEEPVIAGSTGQKKASPFFRIEAEADADAHKYAEALMLTPEMLQRHLKGEDDDDDGVGF